MGCVSLSRMGIPNQDALTPGAVALASCRELTRMDARNYVKPTAQENLGTWAKVSLL